MIESSEFVQKLRAEIEQGGDEHLLGLLGKAMDRHAEVFKAADPHIFANEQREGGFLLTFEQAVLKKEGHLTTGELALIEQHVAIVNDKIERGLYVMDASRKIQLQPAWLEDFTGINPGEGVTIEPLVTFGAHWYGLCVCFDEHQTDKLILMVAGGASVSTIAAAILAMLSLANPPLVALTGVATLVAAYFVAHLIFIVIAQSNSPNGGVCLVITPLLTFPVPDDGSWC